MQETFFVPGTRSGSLPVTPVRVFYRCRFGSYELSFVHFLAENGYKSWLLYQDRQARLFQSFLASIL